MGNTTRPSRGRYPFSRLGWFTRGLRNTFKALKQFVPIRIGIAVENFPRILASSLSLVNILLAVKNLPIIRAITDSPLVRSWISASRLTGIVIRLEQISEEIVLIVCGVETFPKTMIVSAPVLGIVSRVENYPVVKISGGNWITRPKAEKLVGIDLKIESVLPEDI
jgi:hypothetical protein